jgi:multidrug efflux pump
MLFATFLGLLFIPVFYTIVRRVLGDDLDAPPVHVDRDSTL